MPIVFNNQCLMLIKMKWHLPAICHTLSVYRVHHAVEQEGNGPLDLRRQGLCNLKSATLITLVSLWHILKALILKQIPPSPVHCLPPRGTPWSWWRCPSPSAGTWGRRSRSMYFNSHTWHKWSFAVDRFFMLQKVVCIWIVALGANEVLSMWTGLSCCRSSHRELEKVCLLTALYIQIAAYMYTYISDEN